VTKRTNFLATTGAARLRIGIVRAALLGLALGGGLPALLTQPARAAVVFSNVTGSSIGGGAVNSFMAAGFTPDSDYDFAGAAAFVRNNDPFGEAPSFSMALYAAASTGGPASPPLWTSGPLTSGRDGILAWAYCSRGFFYAYLARRRITESPLL
jgi:hypothetical protein